jgi:hypothetical protein
MNAESHRTTSQIVVEQASNAFDPGAWYSHLERLIARNYSGRFFLCRTILLPLVVESLLCRESFANPLVDRQEGKRLYVRTCLELVYKSTGVTLESK